jgi:hypothetical protein
MSRKPVVHQASANLVANSALVVSSTIISPRTETLVDLTVSTSVPPDKVVAGHTISRVSPTFKLVFLSVLGITIASGLLQILLASVWPSPTPNQQSAFEAMSLAWKVGIGAIFGLLGGKVT